MADVALLFATLGTEAKIPARPRSVPLERLRAATLLPHLPPHAPSVTSAQVLMIIMMCRKWPKRYTAGNMAERPRYGSGTKVLPRMGH